MIRIIITLILWISISTTTFAQAYPDTSKTELKEVVIEGARFSGSVDEQNNDVQIITSKQIAALPAQNVNEVLMHVAGVDMRRRGPGGAQGDISIDGSTFDQVLVLVNGIKMSDPQTGHHMMNLPIPLETIDHIEIIRGAAGHAYGVNALAGVVNIITKVPVNDMAFGEVYGGSSFEKDTATNETYYHWGVTAGAAMRKNNHSHVLTLSHNRGNGYRYNTGFENYKALYQNEIIFKRHKIEAIGGLIYNEFGANAFYAAPGDRNSMETVQTALGSLSDSWQVNDKLLIKPRFSFRYGKDDYIYIRQRPEVFRNIHETNVVSGDVNATYLSGNHGIGVGVEYRNENIRSTNLGFNTRDHVGVFAEYKIVLKKLSAGAGLYAHYNSDFNGTGGFDFFPGANLGYIVNSNLKFFAYAGTGQRLPTYTDLYYNGPSNIGNANLIPETGFSSEAGFKYHRTIFQMNASVAIRNIDDFIDWTRLDVTDEWQPNNFQSLQTTVYNLRFTYFAGRHLGWQLPRQLNFSSSYSYLDAEAENNTVFESKYAIEALRHQWLSSILFTYGKLSVNASAKYQFRINGNDYTLVDSRISYRVKNFTLFADVNNILDIQYREIASVPLPGRWFGAGVRFSTAR